jgi:hypothetical protein
VRDGPSVFIEDEGIVDSDSNGSRLDVERQQPVSFVSGSSISRGSWSKPRLEHLRIASVPTLLASFCIFVISKSYAQLYAIDDSCDHTV